MSPRVSCWGLNYFCPPLDKSNWSHQAPANGLFYAAKSHVLMGIGDCHSRFAVCSVQRCSNIPLVWIAGSAIKLFRNFGLGLHEFLSRLLPKFEPVREALLTDHLCHSLETMPKLRSKETYSVMWLLGFRVVRW
jgi:hypothetical protein